jgi:LacI family transcriptional regulator
MLWKFIGNASANVHSGQDFFRNAAIRVGDLKVSKRATMVDIANKAEVSQATVSLVLNNAPNVRVSEETRARVKSIAAALGYRKGPAHSLPASGARVIGLLIDEVTTTPFATPLIEGARDEAAQHDCVVAIFCTGGDPVLEATALDVLSGLRLVGVLYSTLITQSVTPPERLASLPSVLLNCHDKKRRLPSVVPADVTGGYAATAALIAAGHRRIAHIAGEGWGEASVDRAKGYREALASHDIPFDKALLAGPAWTVDSGREQALRLLNLAAPPTAIFCFNDRAAIGCYEACHLKGLRVPQDISVVGFDDEDLVSHLLPPLNTMVLPHDEMARWAVNELITLEGSAWPPAHPRRVKTECGYVERGSVAQKV